MPEYIFVSSDEQYKAAAGLFKEYAAWLAIDLAFQHFEEELEHLKEMYAEPAGGIILCKEGGDFIGCVAIRKITAEEGELKRMFVQSSHQHKGIGKMLLLKALDLAKQCGYTVVRLDTLNYMTPAMNLYKQNGFYEIAPYYYNPNETAVYFEKKI